MEPIRIASAELSVMLSRDDVRVLDVRTPGEFESVHIEGAYNVPLDTLGEHGREIAKASGEIVLICQSGARARQAEEILRREGVMNLHLLEGGMNAWLQSGGAVRRGRRRMSLERQVRIVAGFLVFTGAALALGIDLRFAILPLLVGGGLMFAGITDICAMGLLLARMPWNGQAACDSAAVVSTLLESSGRLAREQHSR